MPKRWPLTECVSLSNCSTSLATVSETAKKLGRSDGNVSSRFATVATGENGRAAHSIASQHHASQPDMKKPH